MGTQICVCKDWNLDNWVYSMLYSLHTDTVLLSSCGRPRKFTATTSLIRFVRLSFYVLCASGMRNQFFFSGKWNGCRRLMLSPLPIHKSIHAINVSFDQYMLLAPPAAKVDMSKCKHSQCPCGFHASFLQSLYLLAGLNFHQRPSYRPSHPRPPRGNKKETLNSTADLPP
jgi:hypothetical protein